MFFVRHARCGVLLLGEPTGQPPSKSFCASVFFVNVHPTIGHKVSSGLKVGAARGSQKLGQTSPEVGGHIVPVHEDQG